MDRCAFERLKAAIVAGAGGSAYPRLMLSERIEQPVCGQRQVLGAIGDLAFAGGWLSQDVTRSASESASESSSRDLHCGCDV
ncbi:MAG: hypothetical protein ACI8UD_003256 [Planctomycetota bacterium]|jgi:hypothetical protein